MPFDPSRAVLFNPGNCVMTGALMEELLPTFPSLPDFQRQMTILIGRHVSGDWGNVDEHDKGVNNDAVKTGARIISEYLVNDMRVWIITDQAWDCENPRERQVTTFMRPEDY